LQLIQYAKACSTYDQFLIFWQSNNKLIDVTGVSTVSLTGNFLQIFQSYNDLVWQYNLLLGLMLSDVSYQSLSLYWYTGFNYGSSRLPKL
jgi:hypothetical protein